jgi:GntR family transcriptional regulator
MPLETPRSQYRQLADQIRAAIEAGEYPPGSALPSEPEMASRYDVSRPTVNRAVAILRNEGLVHVRRGVGASVREIPVIRRDATTRYQKAAREQAGSRGAFDGEIRRLGMEPRSDVEVSLVIPPPLVSAALGLPEGVPNTIQRMRRMYANDIPIQMAPSYIPAAIAEGTPIAEVDSGPGGIVSRFEELGYAQVRITETVRVRRPDDEERRFLRLEDGQQVIEIWHTGWTAEGRAVEVCVCCVPAHLWALDYGWAVS